jgi:hypothetical protein
MDSNAAISAMNVMAGQKVDGIAIVVPDQQIGPEAGAQKPLNLADFKADHMDPIDRPRRHVVGAADMEGSGRDDRGLTLMNRKHLAGQRQPSLALETPEKDQLRGSLGTLAMMPSRVRIVTDVARRKFEQQCAALHHFP